jgi:hypothetical protein
MAWILKQNQDRCIQGRIAKVLISSPGPQEQVFVLGVEIISTLYTVIQGTVILVLL